MASGTALAPQAFGSFVVFDDVPLVVAPSTPGEFAPSPLPRRRAAKRTPFDAGPFALYRLNAPNNSADTDAIGWRVALRDMLRAPPASRRLQILEAGGVEQRVPLYFVTPFVFGIPIAAVIDALDQGRGTAPDEIATALVDELMWHIADGVQRDIQDLRPRLARPDALRVTLSGHVVDFCSAPFPLSDGPAAGHVDFDRAARAYGALLSRVLSPVTEAPAFLLLDAAQRALDWKPSATDTSPSALAAFVRTHFANELDAHEAVIEQHALLDDTALNRLAARNTIA